MGADENLAAALRVEPGAPAGLARRDPRDTLGLDKTAGQKLLEALHERLDLLQRRLFAESTRSLLLVLQGLDAAGKDGVIRSVFAGVNPLGCKAVSFRVPTATELAHDYLWRVHAQLPARGEIGIFNRSHYEDVVAVRMHRLAPEAVWRKRPGHIREWERMLVDEGTTLVKVFLHVSKDEQRQRLQERIDDPEKRWKFRRDDLKVRERFDEYLAAYEDVVTETSTDWAPWHVVPADRNWLKAAAVAQLLVDALERIDPQPPAPEPGIEGMRIV
jgi:PPK2 family polyphosphate:nucleotide phosphotransferase